MLAGTIEEASAEIKHFDLSQLPALLSPGHVLPHSDVNAVLDAKGPLDLPEIGGHFKAEADGNGQHDLIHITATGEGRLAVGRLNARTFATIGGQKVSAKVDMPMPLRPHQPIDVSFDASVLLSPWFASALVPKIIQTQPIIMYALGAKVTAQGSISGIDLEPACRGERARGALGRGQLARQRRRLGRIPRRQARALIDARFLGAAPRAAETLPAS